MKRSIALAVVLLLFAAPGWGRNKSRIEVMTQNQFLGADLTPALGALASGDPVLIAEVLAATLQQMADNNFPARAGKLAEQICRRQAHVVGLQEVFRFEIGGVSGPPAPLPFVDQLDELMAAIADQCGNYVVGASIQNVDVSQVAPRVGLVRFVDRDVVLVRDDVPFAPVPFAPNVCEPRPSGVPGIAPSGCHFQALVPLPASIGGSILRGYLGVDAFVDGEPYRVVNTHLEVQRPDGTDFSSVFQALQAAELIGVLAVFPAAPGTRIIPLGDINSSPEDPIIAQPIQPPPFPIPPPFATTIIPPYTQFKLSGYTDVWDERPGKSPGYTCCNDEDLILLGEGHGERIDVIFSSQLPAKVKASVIGGKANDRVEGLWPSDHCTVSGNLTY